MSFQGIDYTTPLSVRSIGRVFRSETSNLKVQTNSSQAQRWDLQITLAPTSDTAQIVDLEDHRFQMGIHTSFTTLMPQPLGVANRIAGVVTNISTRGVTAAGVSDVAIDSTSTVTIPKGLYVTFGADPQGLQSYCRRYCDCYRHNSYTICIPHRWYNLPLITLV